MSSDNNAEALNRIKYLVQLFEKMTNPSLKDDELKSNIALSSLYAVWSRNAVDFRRPGSRFARQADH